jgi:fucose permease
MVTILLVIIYISFISLGLPDALLGSAWPSMYQELQVPISYAGIISMLVSGGTIISSLFSGKLIRRFGTGKLTAISVGLTAVALYGFSVSNSFFMICLFTIPYGLGAGSVDAVLNNFVALHYKARHMSWLHCFWGVGASVGPYVMGYCLTRGLEWNSGYRVISLIQIVLTAILIFSLPLWKKNDSQASENQELHENISLKKVISIKGAKPALIAFFAYCAVETSTGLWGSSYMVMDRGISIETAAKWTSLFYLGITFGRFISGFITTKLGNLKMIRLGEGIAMLGIEAMVLPFGNGALFVGFILIGLGCAPIYPSMLHSTPENFGRNISQALMGEQMSCAYVGSTFMPPVLGLLAEHISIKLYPFFLFVFALLLIVMEERLFKIKAKNIPVPK